MKLLLDTHLVLWSASTPERLAKETRKLLLDKRSELMVSVVSFWEIVIKRGLGRSDFQIDPGRLRRGLRENGWLELPILSEHALALERLPPLHRDPFDRMLIAQAEVESVTLLTADEMVATYPGPIRRV